MVTQKSLHHQLTWVQAPTSCIISQALLGVSPEHIARSKPRVMPGVAHKKKQNKNKMSYFVTFPTS